MLLEPDLSLNANLRRLAVLVKDWQGQFLDSAATVCAINPDAGSVPVYWCFNSAAERDSLAGVFGANQTLVGMRSLNTVVRVTPELSHVLDPLAKHYADALQSWFGKRPCIVGGNCQAAGIAWRVANHLLAADVPVQRLVLLDAEPRLPFGGRVRLLFGERSHAYNPFLKPLLDPARPIPWHWERAWHRFETRIVSGGHGQYFRPENVPSLARAILEPDVQAPAWSARQDAQPEDCSLVTCRIVEVAPRSTTIEVAIPASVKVGDKLGLLPLWRKDDGSLMATPGPDWIVPVGAGPIWRRTFESPFSTPGATLIPILCLAGYGPLTWPTDLQVPPARGADLND